MKSPGSSPSSDDGAWVPEAAERSPFGLYLHIPFCEKKCPYCDFNTFAHLDSLFDAYVEALCQDILGWGHRLARPRVDTLFLGGGTPSILDPEHLHALLAAAAEAFQIGPDCEITAEANPGSAESHRFRALHELGVNRISLGVQSFQPDELRFLGRVHNREEALAAFERARAAGFEAVNLDLIFGLPEQSTESWRQTLLQALHLRPEHLSLYSLIVEPATPLHRWVESGRVAVPDDDQTAPLYELAMELLADAGYRHYEVSNWALDGTQGRCGITPLHASRHNLGYWRNEEYLGLGPGAHSHLRRPMPEPDDHPPDDRAVARRWGGRRTVPDYIRRIGTQEPIAEFSEWLDPQTAMGESMMLGLRLVEEGVERHRFRRHHGVDPLDQYASTLAHFRGLNLIQTDDERIRLTPRGLLLANGVSGAFLP